MPRKRGRPPVGDNSPRLVRRSVYMPPELAEKIDRQADKNYRSGSAETIIIIEDWFQLQEAKKEAK